MHVEMSRKEHNIQQSENDRGKRGQHLRSVYCIQSFANVVQLKMFLLHCFYQACYVPRESAVRNPEKLV